MIETSLLKTFNRRHSGIIGAPRYSGDPVLFEDGSAVVFAGRDAPKSLADDALGWSKARELYESGNQAGVPGDEPQVLDEEGAGVSVVLIETKENEGR